MTTPEQMVLDQVTLVPGVRCALLVSAGDGLVVAESAQDGEDTAAIAALAAHLARRLEGLTGALDHSAPSLMLLQGSQGQLFVAYGSDGLLLVAVTGPDVNIGQVRLAILNAAGQLH